MKKFTNLALAIAAAMTLTGCDEAKDAAQSLKNSIPTIEEPVVQVEKTRHENPFLDAMLPSYIKITSKDNATILRDVIVNRGNCGIVKYVLDKAKLQEYKAAHPNNVFPGDKAMLEAGSDLVPLRDAIYNTQEGLSFYDSLNSSSKAVYSPSKVFSGKALPFGESVRLSPTCDISKIIEIEVQTSGGTFSFQVQ